MSAYDGVPTYADVVGRLARGQFAALSLGDQAYTITPARDPDGRFVSFQDPAATAKPLLMAARTNGEDGYRWATRDLEPDELDVGPFSRADLLPLDENGVAADAQPADPRRGERAFLAALADVKRRLEGLAGPDRA